MHSMLMLLELLAERANPVGCAARKFAAAGAAGHACGGAQEGGVTRLQD
jgi:hypothetical protein